MVEIISSTTNTSRRIGAVRDEWLYLASKTMAEARELEDLRVPLGFMRAFESTLTAGSEAKKEYLRHQEELNMDQRQEIINWEKWKQEHLGYLEQFDAQRRRDQIEAKYIGLLLDFCYDLTRRYGLSND